MQTTVSVTREENFGYRNVEILKEEENSLGIGSYGAVYKARCDDLPCAAKILHPTLFQSNDPGARRLLQRFEQECSFMNRIRHPNIVLYLGACRDQQSGLPVLLMELLDESLTKFLEKSEEPLPFHTQVNLCQDIALAISYLHSNNIIHRDLSSNNILILAGSKAKVTDFGMSKLADSGGLMSRFSRLSLTHCPGTEVYMPPEAIKDKPSYTNISLINPEHTLLPTAMDCLQYKPEERPTAHEPCDRVTTLKASQQYSDSKQSVEEMYCRQERALNEKDDEIKHLEEQQTNYERQIEGKDEEIRELQRNLQAKEHEMQALKNKKRLHEIKEEILSLSLQATPVEKVLRPKPWLPRSVSTVNLETSRQCTECRSLIWQDWVSRAPPGGSNFFQSTPCFTFTLPSLRDHHPKFRQFVYDCLIDKETQRILEEENCLNWLHSTTTLYPLYTMKGGNSLLHAASLDMWGFQDRDYVLRNAVYEALKNHHDNTLNQRWRHSRHLENQKQGLQLEPHQWDQEWQRTVNMASLEVPPGKNMESLEEFHVFVLANVLRRPIIMYADPEIRSLFSDFSLLHLNFRGIYLPLLWEPKSCKKDPLPLAYHAGHFSALCAVDSDLTPQSGPHLILPLNDYWGQILPVRYALPVEDPSAMQLIMDYLDLIQIRGIHTSPYISTPNIICAKLSIPEVPKYQKPLLSEAGFIDACWEAYGRQQTTIAQPVTLTDPVVPTANAPQKCTECHEYYGDPDKLGMCSKCYNKTPIATALLRRKGK